MLKFTKMSMIPILIAFLLVIIVFFFSTEFQSSLISFPGLSTGLVAVLTVLTTGVISLIVKIVDIEHAKNERRSQRAYTIIDEKYKVIISGMNLLEVQFQKYGSEIASILTSYSPSLDNKKLKSLLVPYVQISEERAILFTEIASLDDEKLNMFWQDVQTSWTKCVSAHERLVELLEKLIENPAMEKPINLNEATTYSMLMEQTNAFVAFAGQCKKRLTELRITELKNPEEDK